MAEYKSMKNLPLVILAGPTAAGKTSIAIKLARELNAEIISADSVQVYRKLDIGSAKPTMEEQAQAAHYLIDICEPHENMDAGRFAQLAGRAMRHINSRGKNALVVGGTGLYIKALLFGLAAVPPVDESLRQKLATELEEHGLAHLYQRFKRLDPAGAARINPNDRQRVLRALEVIAASGRPLSSFHNEHNKTPRYPYLLWVLDLPRNEVKERIASRGRQMWQNGLLEETKALLESGLAPGSHALSSLGYCQAVAFLNGQIKEEEALTQMIKQTTAYAKRQLTWFKKMPGVKWIKPENWRDMIEPSLTFIKQNQGNL